MNKVVYVLLGLSLAANGYFLVNSDSQKERVIVKEVTTQKAEVKSQVEDKIVKQMRAKESEGQDKEQLYLDKIAELENEIALLQEQIAGKSQTENSQDNQVESVTISSTREVDEKILEEFNRYNPKEMFESQPVDPEWAFERQDGIYELITNSDLMSQLNVSDVECKTSVCKVSLKTFDDKHSAKMMAMMDTSELLRKSELLSGLSSQTSLKPGTNELYMYFYKEDEEASEE